MAPLDNAIQISPHLPTSVRQSLKARARMTEVGERQPYCHTNVLDVGLTQNQVVFLVRMAPLSSRKSV